MRPSRPLITAVLACIASAQPGASADEPTRPQLHELSTLDLNMVEATPVVFKDRLYRFE